MEICNDNGIAVSEKGRIFVDSAGGKGKDILISHAHSDHGRINSSNHYYTTGGTAALLRCRSQHRKISLHEYGYGKKFDLKGFTVSLHDAAHVLGSSQIRIEGSADLVITSDFNPQRDLLFRPAEVLRSGILVLETTFGLPEFVFPEREAVYSEMASWVKANLREGKFVVLGGYSLGKAQELTAFANEYVSEAPLVYPRIYENNLIYEENNIRLGDYIELKELKEGSILIIPPHLLKPELLGAIGFSVGKKVAAAVATGWGQRYSSFRVFPLSGHPDFSQLLNYVRESEPKLVLTHHGFASEFAGYVRRRLGIPARELGGQEQRTIMEFGFSV